MTEPAIREVRPEDAPALTALWAQTFGDSEALIRCFFRLLPGMGGGVTAEALVESAMGHVHLLNDCGFDDICISVKCLRRGGGPRLSRARPRSGAQPGGLCARPRARRGDPLHRARGRRAFWLV